MTMCSGRKCFCNSSFSKPNTPTFIFIASIMPVSLANWEAQPRSRPGPRHPVRHDLRDNMLHLWKTGFGALETKKSNNISQWIVHGNLAPRRKSGAISLRMAPFRAG
jgi:hypothetical protein